jgi:four helix bundle protein
MKAKSKFKKKNSRFKKQDSKRDAMTAFSDNLSERFMMIAVNIIKLEKQLCISYSGRHIYGQLFRSGTSAGANFEEARAGESRADFVHKMQIVLKELREANYWLKLTCEATYFKPDYEVLKLLMKETNELAKIIAKSVFTAKSKINKNLSTPQT